MEYDRSLADLLRYAVSQKSSAAHFGEGIPPAIRIDNQLIHLECAPFTRDKAIKFILEFLSEDKFRDFEGRRNVTTLSACRTSDGFVPIFLSKETLLAARLGFCRLNR